MLQLDKYFYKNIVPKNRSVHQLDNYFYKNIVPNWCTDEKNKQIKINGKNILPNWCNEEKQTQKCNPIETLFYRNINPIALQEGKRIKINGKI